MKKKEKEELKAKNTSQLKEILKEKEKGLIVDQIELKMGKIKNVHIVHNKKKDIATVKTMLKAAIFKEQQEK
ncbi:50S ribosomal protein L29 [Candidatus Curtissbacteria bacterium]|nr:50S ribosomal protein L29 [Candidatus Curtissbacteria bacterium]